MKKWAGKFRKNTGLSPYVWIVFYILPFYFIVQDSSTPQIVIGILMISGYFICYVLSFASKGWLVYLGASVQIAISTAMSIFFGYIYFFLFLAFFIGNIKRKSAFITLYIILLITTFSTSYYGLVTHSEFIIQLPFVFLCIIAVILLPVSTYNKNKEEILQGQLEYANKRIAELVKLEERQRISRDLHDTLGQKLSLIGLKSDLAAKLINKDPIQAHREIKDVQQTARIALQEVRELVIDMRGTKLEDEILRVKEILKAANIQFHFDGTSQLNNTSLIAENVVSMCLKEAITNVIKHSDANTCELSITPTKTDLIVEVKDDGKGIGDKQRKSRGSGLQGMRERLEFINGNLSILSEKNKGTTIKMFVPNTNYLQVEEGGIQ
ncbi:sensor histidine kinase [Evansella cellulosilytica]|uniref:Oxygen sensor histidine kinase NreB n=1 Tax=Evansella cellulosilytica (strain ATCC 21833 / DSM 2522 / FERM P-1141 / JCM 9156 / N-4) TaxID=649639 RepID=E6TQL0_EVAC2|nr:sensor histidine kinase [Evansella cellulosilytica]ADU30521.1 integral membrane sensor signal transduction histidine kinase [Evansella cellulosilytica DSM 2522]